MPRIIVKNSRRSLKNTDLIDSKHHNKLKGLLLGSVATLALFIMPTNEAHAACDSSTGVMVCDGEVVDAQTLTGASASLENSGNITVDGAPAVTSDATDTTITNSGRILSTSVFDAVNFPLFDVGVGVDVTTIGTGTLTIDNQATGEIIGGRFGVGVRTSQEIGDVTSNITNAGLIEGGDDGLRLIGGTVTNSGTIRSTGLFAIPGSTSLTSDGISSNDSATTTAEELDAGFSTINNQLGGLIEGPRSGVLLSGGGTVNNDGTITGGEAGVIGQGSGLGIPVSLTVNNTGLIEATSGSPTTGFSGASGTHNTAGIFGLSSIESMSITNSGTIQGATNAITSMTSTTLVNEATGVIIGDANGDNIGAAFHGASTYDFDPIDGVPNIPEGLTFDDNITNAGTITGAVELGLGNDVVVNSGTVTAQGDAISSEGTSTSITNSGTITGSRVLDSNSPAFDVASGISVSSLNGGTFTLDNQATGIITGGRFGVGVFAGENDRTSTITNAGLIEGGDDGLRLSGGTVTNSGIIRSTGLFAFPESTGIAPIAADGISSVDTPSSIITDPDAAFTTINNESGGLIEGPRTGVILFYNGVINNDGTITGGEAGVVGEGSLAGLPAVFTVNNTGLIEATNSTPSLGLLGGVFTESVAVGGSGNLASMNITNSGTIRGASHGVGSETSMTLVNEVGGEIIGDADGDGVGYAIIGAATSDFTDVDGVVSIPEGWTFDDSITNAGTITGNVSTGLGNDNFTNQGIVNGTVDLGEGDDIYNFFAGATQNGAASGGVGEDILRLSEATVETPTELDGTLFTEFETLENNAAGTINMFFSGAVTFDTISATSGTLEIGSGTLEDKKVEVANDATLDLGAEVTVINTLDGAVAVDISGDNAAVNNTGSVTATGANSDAMVVSGNQSVIDNAGTILASGTGDSAAIRITSLAGEVSTITNNGTVEGTVTAVVGGDGDEVFANNGSVVGTVNLNGGDDTFAIGDGSTVAGTVDGGSGADTLALDLDNDTASIDLTNFTNFDTLAKQGEGDVKLDGDLVFDNVEVEDGVLSVNGNLTGEVSVMEGGQLGGNGMIEGTVVNDGDLGPGNSIDTLNIMGDYTQSATGTLEIELAEAGSSDKLLISGTATLAGNIKIVPTPVVAGETLVGESYTVLSAVGGITGGLTLVDSDQGDFRAFNFAVGANDVTVDVSRLNFNIAGLTNRQASVANAMDVLYDDGVTAENKSFLDAAILQQRATSGDMFELIASDAVTAQATALVATHDQMLHSLTSNARMSRGNGNWSVWLSGYGTFGNVDASAVRTGFDYTGTGIVVGANYEVGSNTNFSFGLGTSKTNIDQDVSNSDGSVKSINLVLGLNSKLMGMDVDAVASVNFDDYDTQHVVNFGSINQSLLGSGNGTTYASRIAVSKRVDSGNVTFVPMAALTAIDVTRDAFSETGQGNFGLNYDKNDHSSVRSEVGAMLQFNPTTDGSYMPYLGLYWDKELNDGDKTVTASFATNANASFSYGGALANDSALRAIAGVRAFNIGRAGINLRYQGVFGSNETSHSVGVNLSMNW